MAIKTTAEDAATRIAKTVLDAIAHVPITAEQPNALPEARARMLASTAALQASALAGTLALPPGPAGLVTILPELLGVWRIQAQMVADIAGAFGKAGALSQEQMLYCLFKHSAAQAVRDLVMRVGERYLIRHVGVRVIQRVAATVGIKITHRAIARSVARWLPVVGAVGVAGYAYYDTSQVATTAIAFFEREIEVEQGTAESDGAAQS
jgi:hypothetical protein